MQPHHSTKTVVDTSTKCITCGNSIKRKGFKHIRCEACIKNDSVIQQQLQQQQQQHQLQQQQQQQLQQQQQQQQHIQHHQQQQANTNQNNNNRAAATQIFVAPDGDVKFEIGEMSVCSESMNCDDEEHGDSDAMPAPTQASNSSKSSKNNIVHNSDVDYLMPGYYPVKKRNAPSVTKCNKCNGSGVIFVGGNPVNHKNIKVEMGDGSVAGVNSAGVQQVEKPFHCNICGGSFSRYSSLWSHKKLHSGEKNYKCTICGLAFAKAVYLKNHSRIHTGEKPYK